MIRYGMVGGGPGAFIGEVHRMAAAIDGKIALVAGAFSSDPDRSHAQGAELGLDPDRTYASFQEMAEKEAERPADERIHFVSIVTPNHLHFEPARQFLEAGFDIVCDKPMTTTIEDAETLCRLVAERGAIFALTHNYTGYPMVKEAREWVQGGRLGAVRKICVDYVQGWLSEPVEETGQRQAAWRTDPERAGVAGALGDIGTHAHNLVRYVTGLDVEAICADLTTFVDGRRLEDDASLLLRFVGGARGTLTASQIAIGEDNGLTLRVYGTEASLLWRQEEPETLWLRRADGLAERHRRGHAFLSEAARNASRLPPGHPEGFIEGFANIYRAVAGAIAAKLEGREATPFERDFPTARDGARGVHFLHRAVEAGRAGGWLDARYVPPSAPNRPADAPGSPEEAS